MSGIIGLVIAILVAILFAWLAVRAWHLRNPALRIVTGLLASLLTVGFLAISAVGLLGAYRLFTPHGAPAGSVTAQASADEVNVATRRLIRCAGCHSSTGNLPLDGGNDNLLGGSPLGSVFAPNLTPGGPLKDWSDAEIIRAIREGVDREGHPEVSIMPSDAFHNLGDADVQAIVAVLRSQPAANHSTPPRDLSLLGMVLIGAGLFPTAEQPHISQPQSAPPDDATPSNGKYLVDTFGCAMCHGANLQGRPAGGFGPPAGPNLRPLVGSWQEAAFISFMRTGVDPYGRTIDPEQMPWDAIGKAYTDDELRAMYTYIKTLA